MNFVGFLVYSPRTLSATIFPQETLPDFILPNRHVGKHNKDNRNDVLRTALAKGRREIGRNILSPFSPIASKAQLKSLPRFE